MRKKKIKAILESDRPKRSRMKIGDRPSKLKKIREFKEKLEQRKNADNWIDPKISFT